MLATIAVVDEFSSGYFIRRHAMIDESSKVTHRFDEPGSNDSNADGDPQGETAPEKLTNEAVAQAA